MRIASCDQGTALMTEEASVAAKYCTFGSESFLGAVLKRAEGHREVTYTPRASFRGCAFKNNMWGGFFGNNLSTASEAALVTANTFRSNQDEDVTRMYEYTGYDVQPWRRDWVNTQFWFNDSTLHARLLHNSNSV